MWLQPANKLQSLVGLTWLKLGDTRPNALHDAGSFVAENHWEAIFVHPLKQVVEVGVAHARRRDLQTGKSQIR